MLKSNRIKRRSVIALISAILLIFAPLLSNENLKGLLSAIDYSGDDLETINNLSVEDVEWFLYEANLEDAFHDSGPRILLFIGKGLKRNEREISKQSMDEYIDRSVEIAELASDEHFFPETLTVLEYKFDHPAVRDYLEKKTADRNAESTAASAENDQVLVPSERGRSITGAVADAPRVQSPEPGDEKKPVQSGPVEKAQNSDTPVWPYVLVAVALVGIVVVLVRSRKRSSPR